MTEPKSFDEAAEDLGLMPSELDKRAPKAIDALEGTIDQMKRRIRGDERPIPTPWPALNKAMRGGLWPGVHFLVGATGTGKTQLALQVAWEAAKAERPVLYVGLELGKHELNARLIGIATESQWSDIIHPGPDQDEDRLSAIVEKAKPLLRDKEIRLHTADAMAWDASQISELADLIKPMDGGPFLIVVDYLQAIGPGASNPSEGLRERIGRASYTFRDCARNHGAAVLALSSTARANYEATRGDASQRSAAELVGLGKEAGEIEYSADSVLVLCKDEGETKLGIAKLRSGPSGGWVSLKWNGGWYSADRRERTPVGGRRNS